MDVMHASSQHLQKIGAFNHPWMDNAYATASTTAKRIYHHSSDKSIQHLKGVIMHTCWRKYPQYQIIFYMIPIPNNSMLKKYTTNPVTIATWV